MRTTIKKIDFVIQVILIGLIAIPSLLSLFGLPELLIISFYLAPLLGLWQLVSSASWGVVEKDKKRGMYLLAAASYILALWAGVTVVEYISIDWIVETLAFLAFIPPIGLGIYCVWLSWKAAYSNEQRFASFWDI